MTASPQKIRLSTLTLTLTTLATLSALMPLSSLATPTSGILTGKQQIIIKAKSQGEIIAIKIAEGSSIRKDDVIAIIDDKQESIELQLAKSEYITAKNDFEKNKQLKKYLSLDELNKKENEFLKKKSAYDLKNLSLENTRITSPINGIIAKRYYNLGETVASGDKVYEVVNMDDLIIELDITPAQLKNLKQGDSIPFHAEDAPHKKFSAQISFIAPTIDSVSGSIRVILELKNFKEKNSYVLKPGSLVIFDL
ncbi:MAG: efflux RND transporter periplasmic adaptor subunit [Oligoflexia bacterium]|nr:efflux RND transporter periplasmic adaptor subunit [Oligoflexia bacterium]MBF0365530.1 efflux RND transporter periplasmic adaptor subunit [Oligoflexia bacterium]